MLERVDPESVTVGERDPVLVDVNEPGQRGVDVGGQVTQQLEVTSLVFRVQVVQESLAQVAVTGAGVASRVLKLDRPGPLVDRRDRLDGFTGGPEPVPEVVVLGSRQKAFLFDVAGIVPVLPGVVEGHI
jgi:hypothetical protein